MRVPTISRPDEATKPRAVDVLFDLRRDGNLDTAPLELTDWSAQLADAFGAVESATVWLAGNTARCIEQAANTEYYAANGLYLACVAVKAEVGGWRREVAAMPELVDAVKAGCAL